MSAAPESEGRAGPQGDVDVVSELDPDDGSLLEVSGLDAFYGPAHVLQDVTFTMGDEPVAIIGRNGMGKTTLCNAIMQIRPATTRGSIRFRGEECVGRPSYKIAALGIGYIPQGRRLFESLTVDEHLRMLGPVMFAWSTHDITTTGAIGDPRPATRARGDDIVRLTVERCAEILGEIAGFEMPIPAGSEDGGGAG